MYRSGSRGTSRPHAYLQQQQQPQAGESSRSAAAPSPPPGAFKRKAFPRLPSSDDSDDDLSIFAEGGSTSGPSRPSYASTSQISPPASSSTFRLPTTNAAGTEGDEYFMCTWRKPQARKHKTWDGDAVLIVNRSRKTGKLKCQASGNQLAMSSNFQPVSLDGGEELTIGGKEIEIDRQISHREYLSGIPESPQYPAKKVKATPASSRASPTHLNTARPSAMMAAAPSTSFYSKPLPKPQNKKEHRGLSPEVQRALQDEEPSRKPSPSKSSPSIQSRPAGLFERDSPAQPRYDPQAAGAIVMKRPSEEHQRKYNRKGYPLVDVVINPILSETLRPHQVEGVKFLYEKVTGISEVSNDSKGAILADEMGLGKTLQTITLIETLLRQSPYYTSRPCFIEKAIVVCPLTLVKNWKREFRKWLGPTTLGVVGVDGTQGKEVAQRFVTSKRDQVLIIGYEKLRSVIDILAKAQPPVGLIVCDEGHRLKSKDAKTTKMFDQLSTPRRIILTGTPIQNDLSELYAMLDFVCPGLLGTYAVFKTVFEDPILKSRIQHATKEAKELGHQRSLTLGTVTGMVVLRRTAEILDGVLLPKSENVVFCSPSKLQTQLYKHVLRSTEVRALTSGGAGGSALPLITMLRQICDSPELLLKNGSAGSSKSTLASDMLNGAMELFPTKPTPGDETLSGKLTVIAKMLKTIRAKTDDKVVLVSTFTATLDVLEAFCKKKRYSYVRLDGQTKADDRQGIVNHFNSGSVTSAFIFLLSTRAGGAGINLIGANRLFMIEPEWNPAHDKQAMARIHRDGQRKHCHIYRLMLAGTMDEKIFQRQLTKQGLSDTLMNAHKDKSNGGSSTGASSSRSNKSGGDSFSQEELKDIFTLHEDTPCLCHDLLVCTCGGRGVKVELSGDDAPGEGSDDDDELPSFIPASQQPARQAEQMAKAARYRLAGLADWRHVDTTDSADFTSLNDDMLNSVIKEQVVPKMEPARPANVSWSSEDELEEEANGGTSKSLLDQLDPDHIESELAKQQRERIRKGKAAAATTGEMSHLQRRRGGANWTMDQRQGGDVLYVFTKTSGETPEVGEGGSSDDEAS